MRDQFLVAPIDKANGNVTLTCKCTAQKTKFAIKDFFSKCDQIRRKLKKSLK